MIRKCSIDLVLLHVPDEYKGFIKMITEVCYSYCFALTKELIILCLVFMAKLIIRIH